MTSSVPHPPGSPSNNSCQLTPEKFLQQRQKEKEEKQRAQQDKSKRIEEGAIAVYEETLGIKFDSIISPLKGIPPHYTLKRGSKSAEPKKRVSIATPSGSKSVSKKDNSRELFSNFSKARKNLLLFKNSSLQRTEVMLKKIDSIGETSDRPVNQACVESESTLMRAVQDTSRYLVDEAVNATENCYSDISSDENDANDVSVEALSSSGDEECNGTFDYSVREIPFDFSIVEEDWISSEEVSPGIFELTKKGHAALGCLPLAPAIVETVGDGAWLPCSLKSAGLANCTEYKGIVYKTTFIGEKGWQKSRFRECNKHWYRSHQFRQKEPINEEIKAQTNMFYETLKGASRVKHYVDYKDKRWLIKLNDCAKCEMLFIRREGEPPNDKRVTKRKSYTKLKTFKANTFGFVVSEAGLKPCDLEFEEKEGAVEREDGDPDVIPWPFKWLEHEQQQSADNNESGPRFADPLKMQPHPTADSLTSPPIKGDEGSFNVSGSGVVASTPAQHDEIKDTSDPISAPNECEDDVRLSNFLSRDARRTVKKGTYVYMNVPPLTENQRKPLLKKEKELNIEIHKPGGAASYVPHEFDFQILGATELQQQIDSDSELAEKKVKKAKAAAEKSSKKIAKSTGKATEPNDSQEDVVPPDFDFEQDLEAETSSSKKGKDGQSELTLASVDTRLKRAEGQLKCQEVKLIARIEGLFEKNMSALNVRLNTDPPPANKANKLAEQIKVDDLDLGSKYASLESCEQNTQDIVELTAKLDAILSNQAEIKSTLESLRNDVNALQKNPPTTPRRRLSQPGLTPDQKLAKRLAEAQEKKVLGVTPRRKRLPGVVKGSTSFEQIHAERLNENDPAPELPHAVPLGELDPADDLSKMLDETEPELLRKAVQEMESEPKLPSSKADSPARHGQDPEESMGFGLMGADERKREESGYSGDLFDDEDPAEETIIPQVEGKDVTPCLLPTESVAYLQSFRQMMELNIDDKIVDIARAKVKELPPTLPFGSYSTLFGQKMAALQNAICGGDLEAEKLALNQLNHDGWPCDIRSDSLEVRVLSSRKETPPPKRAKPKQTKRSLEFKDDPGGALIPPKVSRKEQATAEVLTDDKEPTEDVEADRATEVDRLCVGRPPNLPVPIRPPSPYRHVPLTEEVENEFPPAPNFIYPYLCREGETEGYPDLIDLKKGVKYSVEVLKQAVKDSPEERFQGDQDKDLVETVVDRLLPTEKFTIAELNEQIMSQRVTEFVDEIKFMVDKYPPHAAAIEARRDQMLKQIGMNKYGRPVKTRHIAKPTTATKSKKSVKSSDHSGSERGSRPPSVAASRPGSASSQRSATAATKSNKGAPVIKDPVMARMLKDQVMARNKADQKSKPILASLAIGNLKIPPRKKLEPGQQEQFNEDDAAADENVKAAFSTLRSQNICCDTKSLEVFMRSLPKRFISKERIHKIVLEEQGRRGAPLKTIKNPLNEITKKCVDLIVAKHPHLEDVVYAAVPAGYNSDVMNCVRDFPRYVVEGWVQTLEVMQTCAPLGLAELSLEQKSAIILNASKQTLGRVKVGEKKQNEGEVAPVKGIEAAGEHGAAPIQEPGGPNENGVEADGAEDGVGAPVITIDS